MTGLRKPSASSGATAPSTPKIWTISAQAGVDRSPPELPVAADPARLKFYQGSILILGSFILKARALLLFAIITLIIGAESGASATDAIVENYCAATQRQARMLSAASMEVEISGSIPKLKKQGRLHALRHITALGRITYDALKFQGDDTVKRNVISKYLQAEEQGQQDPSLAVTPDNYKFKYKGKALLEGRDTHLFEVTPRKKRQGLFQGILWVDSATFLRVQESGRLVKNPSVVLRKVQFVRKYRIQDGISVPSQLQTVAVAWLVGKAELTVDYTNFSIDSKRDNQGEEEDR